jgi:hypothetical protein
MATNPADIEVFPASDNTLLVRFDRHRGPEANEQVLALAWQLQHQERAAESSISILHMNRF